MRDALQNLQRAFIPSSHAQEGITPGLNAILYFGKRKRFVGRRRLESPSLLCFIEKKKQQQIGQMR